MRLFLVDDNEPALAEFEKTFQRHGIDVLTAKTKNEALEIIENEENIFDVALLDMVMEEKKAEKTAEEKEEERKAGLTLLRAIRRTRPSVQNVILTAFGTPMNMSECTVEGVFAYVHRETEPRLVVDFVRQAYSQKEGVPFERPDEASTREMWALGLPSTADGNENAETKRQLTMMRAPLPRYRRTDVIAKTLFLGVCGTDVNSFAAGTAEACDYNLIEFHEALGEVEATGSDVGNAFEKGDWVIPMVRRCHRWARREGVPWDFHLERCEHWHKCKNRHRADECLHRPGYLSRGTGKYHGFGSEYFGDSIEYLVKVTKRQKKRLGPLCVLTEPLSVAWKLVREINKRRGVEKLRDRVLVVGIGPIGTFCLAVLNWMYPGLDLYAADLCDHDHYRGRLLTQHFIPKKKYFAVNQEEWPEKLAKPKRKFDIIIDATGDIANVFRNMCRAVAPEGILGLLSISDEEHAKDELSLEVGDFNDIVSCGTKIIGSVCASKQDMEDSLRFMEETCPVDFLERMICPRPFLRPDDAVEKLNLLDQSNDYMKIVIDARDCDRQKLAQLRQA